MASIAVSAELAGVAVAFSVDYAGLDPDAAEVQKIEALLRYYEKLGSNETQPKGDAQRDADSGDAADQPPTKDE
ncbi:MAG: hypothetical protein KDA47_17855 [Planctomycetales bacterium]|nr:hypothetical protein [Planctomycetales bacterium]